MFTGIIECFGTIEQIESRGENLLLEVQSDISTELQVDQSLAHNGICLTVIKQQGNRHWVEAVTETRERTTIGSWKKGQRVNLERAIRVGARLDGHIVQGHVDTVGHCSAIDPRDGSWEFTIQFDPVHAGLVIDKGSIAIDGISLTVVEPSATSLRVAIIPYTYHHTNLGQLQIDESVNLEFDLVGKYISRQSTFPIPSV